MSNVPASVFLHVPLPSYVRVFLNEENSTLVCIHPDQMKDERRDDFYIFFFFLYLYYCTCTHLLVLVLVVHL